MQKFFQYIARTLFFVLISFSLMAQPDPPDDGGDPDVPIPGIGILLALGALFGAKKVYDIRKRK